jgi:CubicO group peptidase (beta-lactamase class C family)
MLRRGNWQGQQLLDPTWVDAALTYSGTPLPQGPQNEYAPASGLAWYTNQEGAWPVLPRDAIAGAGAQHQVLLAVPSLDLIVVRMGAVLDPDTGMPDGVPFWRAVYDHLFQPVLAAVR